MKINLLKELIKEAVREVLREELQSKNLEENLNTIPSIKNSTIEPLTKFQNTPSSINEALNLTKASMTREDFNNIIGTDLIVTEHTQPVPNNSVGLDLSSLDFVKKANTIFNLSKEKDKLK